MNYELCKQLKEAGYSQELGNGYFLDDSSGLGNEQVYFPTLSEIIEALITQFPSCIEYGVFDLIFNWKGQKVWIATLGQVNIGRGSTPEEAVANLWLALNKK